MVRLRRIPAVRAASILALTFGIPYGILLLAFTALFSVAFVTTTTGGQSSTASVGVGPIVSALGSWAVALALIWFFVAVSCGLYNLIAGRFGGIELEFTTIPPEP
jgi:hypothetical protein